MAGPDAPSDPMHPPTAGESVPRPEPAPPAASAIQAGTGARDWAPSGTQFVIGHGHHAAVVTEVGATLRRYDVGGSAVIDGFGDTEICPNGRGQILAPWPNRLGDGRYGFAGFEARAPLDEPERRTSIHGLVRWLPWSLRSSAQNVVTLACTLHPQPAYPWRIELSVEYRLGRQGLEVTTEVVNRSPGPAPFGLGFHPYLTVGTPTVDAAHLQLPARRRLVADERGLPTGELAPVGGTEFDFTSQRSVGPTRLDTAFTELQRDGDGRARAVLAHPGEGRRVTLWVDDRFSYLMVFTGDTVDEPLRRRRAVAIEPMTCPPDALRSGVGVVVLEPGVPWRAQWGIIVEPGTR